jgi:hypothetical protein
MGQIVNKNQDGNDGSGGKLNLYENGQSNSSAGANGRARGGHYRRRVRR